MSGHHGQKKLVCYYYYLIEYPVTSVSLIIVAVTWPAVLPVPHENF
jgi:hypothetical protein